MGMRPIQDEYNCNIHANEVHMKSPIVECIPNFSEGRRPEIVAAIRQVIADVPGVQVLDQHSDLDHNRSVITFAGSPEAVAEAAFRSVAKAAELINLEEHEGEHPRIGATDVLPFVPISGITMAECVELARQVGSRVGEELGIPVYLYEAAATRPDRQNLENIRRGEYEGLKLEIATHPDRQPDFGPAQLGTAGATVIGARQPLIAYNVYLTTSEVGVAKRIARAIRHSSGGLRYVKALGLLVDGRAQVSMNLTDFHSTPIARVMELIRREAARYGVGIHHSELVGLIPEGALVDAAVWYLQLDQFDPEQILEQRLQQAMPVSPDFLDALAADTPTPGGGSASAYSGAAGAALVAMVARLTLGRKKYAAVEDQMRAVLEQAETLRADLNTAVQADARAYEAVMAAYKLPKDTPDEQARRAQAIETASLMAAQVPLEVAQKSVQVMELARQVTSHGNLNAISDGGTAAALSWAAITGAGYNVRINLAGLRDQAPAQSMLQALQDSETKALTLQEEIRTALRERGGISAI